MKKEIVTDLAPEAIGPYSQAIETDGLIFVSGQLPVDRNTGTMPETIEEQAEQSLKNISYILQAVGSSMDMVIKTTVLLADINDFGKVNEVYAKYFNAPYPARACYEVAALPKAAKLEIEAIAAKN